MDFAKAHFAYRNVVMVFWIPTLSSVMMGINFNTMGAIIARFNVLRAVYYVKGWPAFNATNWLAGI